jgi:hypothetical protein
MKIEFDWTQPDPSRDHFYAEAGDYKAWLTHYPATTPGWSGNDKVWAAGYEVSVARIMHDGTEVSTSTDFGYNDKHRWATLVGAKAHALVLAERLGLIQPLPARAPVGEPPERRHSDDCYEDNLNLADLGRESRCTCKGK